MLNGKHILLGVTGSIAAYKSALLVRLLVKEGAEVKVVMTEKAKDFITPLTLSTLSKNPVYCSPFNPESGAWSSHVDLGLWADVMVIAPATANTLAKMASGQADNLLLATYLSAKCPVLFAPAMDLDMFSHPTTERNISTLLSFGNRMIEPTVGDLASGLTGAGRMEEPMEIVKSIIEELKKKSSLKGRRVLVSAGPTYEPIDPVRFIGNHSSGKMGFYIAEELYDRGAEVILVAGPTPLSCSSGIDRRDVQTAAEMLEMCTREWTSSHAAVMAAAVSDFTVENVSPQKIKKQDGQVPEIVLKPTVDILALMGKTKRKDQVLAGFALETENELGNAMKKLHLKNLDFIVLNSLRDEGAGFGVDTNKISILGSDDSVADLPLKLKKELAVVICNELEVRILKHRQLS